MGCSSSAPGTRSTSVKGSFHDRYCLREKIGAGNFAQVYAATRIGNKPSLEKAVKVVEFLDAAKENCIAAARSEVAACEVAARHENCVQFFEVFYCDFCCFMVMERCECDLRVHLKQMRQALTERSLGYIFLQMLRGIAHVHTMGVVHRNVKPDNFLMGRSGTVKLCDFGLATLLPKGKRLHGICGTAPFMSPEMLKGYRYNEKVDVWSFAVTSYCLLFGEFPYSSKFGEFTHSLSVNRDQSMKLAILHGKHATFEPVDPSLTSTSYGESVLSFVKTLLNRQADLRCSADDALRLEYMVAVTDNRHAPDDALPSLQVTLRYAQQNGAFEKRDLTKTTALDTRLTKAQFEAHGVRPSFSKQDSGVKQNKGVKLESRVPLEKCSDGAMQEYDDASTDLGSGISRTSSTAQLPAKFSL